MDSAAGMGTSSVLATAARRLATVGPLPSAADGSAVTQWISGCVLEVGRPRCPQRRGDTAASAAGGYKVTVAFEDESTKTVYATTVYVNLGSPQGDSTTLEELDVSAGLHATGATECTATAQAKR
jgi:hypothetical protein